MSGPEVPEKAQSKSKIAARVRNVNVILLAAVLLLVFAIAYEMFTGITNDASENFARLYSAEAMGKFNLLINQELTPARKVSRSKVITSWIADEDNPIKAAAAYDEMMDYTGVLKNVSLGIGIHRSLHKYTIDGGTPIANFRPLGTMDPSDVLDFWYYDCAGSANEYTLQADTGTTAAIPRFWVNHKVFNGEQLAGVFRIGIPFQEITHGLFSHYEGNNVKGYIIDKSGVIQMNSDLVVPNRDNTGKAVKSITDLYSDSAFDAAMETYLKNIQGYFDSSAQPVVFKLDEEVYSYASIAPIAGTDWSIVTFFSNNALYSEGKILPPLIAILCAFLLYAILEYMLMHRQVFVPLNKLTKSLTAGKYHSGKIFGHDRNDEIGELAQTIQKMWKRLSINNAELLRATREMERLIRIDQLTDIPNRRSFDERLPQEWRRAIREKSSISILMLDLDYFKDYNDTYGHLQGDKALQTVAKIFMHEVKRSGDFVSRWGGEEFIALLTNTDQKGAFDVAEQIRRHIEEARIPLPGNSESKITVSIGINTVIPTPDDSYEEFIRRADMALYAAKKQGRNRVCRNGEEDGTAKP